MPIQYRCPPGFYGRDCSTIYERETASQQPPVVPNEENPEPEVISPCVPFPCGSNAECTTRTVTNSALNETTDVALCQCPPGKTGNADVECFAVDELKEKSDTTDTQDTVRHDLPSDDEEITAGPIEEEVSPSAPSSTVQPLTSTATTAPTTTTTSTTTETPTKAAKKCGTNAIAILSPDGKSVCSCPVGFTGLASIECHILSKGYPSDDDIQYDYVIL
ncbi:unnamed protein product [Orchesella dallaii]|uniref:EGF-like domain-containing protein n=1 Tax=Orchesella dallaii TaxID=48710 RepID=A0ABP1S3M1_9HEXA